jgi:2,3-bisphosphoglycerate-independent phosphoglycerate mutase
MATAQDHTKGPDHTSRPVILIIRDGWGKNPHPEHAAFNAIAQAQTPVADALARDWPTTLIKTSGEDVGLPAGTMGNSEVGHQNIGAGRIVEQELLRINRAAAANGFAQIDAFEQAFAHAEKSDGAVHLLGLVSDGRVHSDIAHLETLIDLAARRGFPGDRLFIHAITDGRDTAPEMGVGFIDRLASKLADAGTDGAPYGRIASVCGRYWAMDRDHRWDRVARAYGVLTSRPAGGLAALEIDQASSAREALERSYAHPAGPSRQGDEFVPPTRMVDSRGLPVATIADGDAVIFFNFRGDRPREIAKAFLLEDDAWANVKEGGFARGTRLDNLFFVGMTRYQQNLPLSAVAFEKPPKMPGILGAVIADAGLTQLRCAETEKVPHVTFFMNDYRDDPFPGEHRALLESPKDVATYDRKPEMAAHAVRDAVLARLAADDCEPLIVVNFANADMVGHTGKLDAIVRAVEVVDACVGQIVDATLAKGGALIISADHGNAEQTWDPVHDCPHTAHTTYDVPLHVVSTAHQAASLRPHSRLADIAPTILALMELERPSAMTGTSLLEA